MATAALGRQQDHPENSGRHMMRLVELIGSRVIDADGQDIGAVHDVRLVAAGPPDKNRRHSSRLTALGVGKGGVAPGPGNSDNELRGPGPLTRLLHRAARRSTIVAWSDVE